jgi:hypothetical protein
MRAETGFPTAKVVDLLTPMMPALVDFCERRRQREREPESPHGFLDPPNMFILLLAWLRKRIDVTTHALRFHLPRTTASEYLVLVLDIALRCHSHLLDFPARINFALASGPFKGACAIVDATLTPIEEQADFDERRPYYTPYSKKSKDSVKALVVFGFNGRILYVSDVRKGAVHDQTFWADSGLVEKLRPDYYAIGDSAYSDCKQVICVTRSDGELDAATAERKHALQQVRSVIENVNHRLKQWQIIHDCWTGGLSLEFMSKVWRFVACLCNFQFEEHPVRHEPVAQPLV